MVVKQPIVRDALKLIAPGTQLRGGIDRILQAGMGAIVVVGDGPGVLALSTGGFLLDAEVTSQRLSELAKMDGAIIISNDATRIARANVHLVPDGSIPTSETGTRHRSAERMARCVNAVVIAVSEELRVVTVYCGAEKRFIRRVPEVLSQANQLLGTLERFKSRLDVSAASLSSLEMGDVVTVKDVAEVFQRAEMVRRVAIEVDDLVVELGREGSLLSLQLQELTSGVSDLRRVLFLDYLKDSKPKTVASVIKNLETLTTEELADLRKVAGIISDKGSEDLSLSLSPRGHRLIGQLPRLPSSVASDIVEYFGSLQRVIRATEDDLGEVVGVGEARARNVKRGLSQLMENNVFDRYT